MPLIQIDLMDGYSDDVYRQLIERCTALYAEHLDAPIERFRTQINVVPPARWGLGGKVAPERVSPLITIELLDGRPRELLVRIMADLSALVAAILGIPVGQTRTLIREFPASHWGIGGVPASEARADEVAARAAVS